MDDVDFGYTDDKIVLHNIDLYAEPGQKIAFVGSTGAGKTTITNLINRFYDIQDGKIRYDGININKIKKGDLRRSLGIVLQDTHLFTDTVMENIRYGRLDATDEEVIAAAKLANADSFIRKLPDGYNTLLKGDGGNLSQGQRQMLAIARAAVADPPALILDEATSSIDTRTETDGTGQAWIRLCTAERPLLLPTDFQQSRIQTVLWFLKRAESSSVVHTNGFLNKRADTISFIQAKPHNDNRKGRVAKALLFLFLKY